MDMLEPRSAPTAPPAFSPLERDAIAYLVNTRTRGIDALAIEAYRLRTLSGIPMPPPLVIPVTVASSGSSERSKNSYCGCADFETSMSCAIR